MLHRISLICLLICFPLHVSRADEATDDVIRKGVSFYASFDKQVRADFGKGGRDVATRTTRDAAKQLFDVKTGFDKKAFRIAPGQGIRGGALQASHVLPRSGRLFFPLKGNLDYKPSGWSGSVSVWINTNPNTMLKTRFCDPVQLTERGASNGGLWFDFTPDNPRNMRMGVFKSLKPGEKAVSSKSSDAPVVTLKSVGFKSGEWHHIVLTWRNLDTGKANARATFYVDGRVVGKLNDRNIAMNWKLEKAGLYFAVNYIGLLDELALFDRELSDQEVKRLHQHPQVLEALAR